MVEKIDLVTDAAVDYLFLLLTFDELPPEPAHQNRSLQDW
jgi:hypothetical protein